jgi:hypothetical protein
VRVAIAAILISAVFTTANAASDHDEALVVLEQKQLRELGLSSARRQHNGIEILIGGIIDNSVGFLNLQSGEPPPISPDEYIWVESLGNGWFLFRTT